MIRVAQQLIALLAGILIALGGLMIAVGIHDEDQPEDGTIIWVCSISGNGKCAPGRPPVQIAPINVTHGW